MQLNKNKIIGIIGLGYVGLPLMLLVNKKYKVLGFDISEKKIEMLKNKKSYISDISDKEIVSIKDENLFLFNENLEQISKCNFLIFCLPTPLKKKYPDMSYIKRAFNKIYPYLKKNQTIILESSVYPGATEEIFLKKLKKKFKLGKNYFLTYSPERIDPGSPSLIKKLEYRNITKLVSGYTEKCEKKILNLYSSIFKNIYLCKSIIVAETSKIFENIYRAVNIGLVNEMKILTDKMKINIHDVVEAAGSKPFGFKKFSPGPGVGGHCIPIDPIFMKWVANKHKHKTKFIDLGAKMNIQITNWTIQKIISLIKNKKKCLILGVAYKADINDIRESPSIKIFKKLLQIKNIDLDYYDPYINNFTLNKKVFYSKKVKNYGSYDFSIICTDHSNFDYKKIIKQSKKIIDTRGVYKDSKLSKIIHL
tara:strand:+ start:1631 stop:2893 length:1263 start_codon:yes stop_codon:yes gene_type:complete